ncbi:hypothetical protein F2Q69_00018243 [Brassica cretica]|uniref:pyruvate decarboxylase n=2 Tax=Brassica cretica TaxID=69181 RepID=A0A8S9QD73_BRACR|nr:hypothetical protein F2Q69_00018243 [Brassica cretica]
MDTKIGSIDACKPTNGDVGSPPSGAVATIHDSAPSSALSVGSSEATLGRHLARRLVQAGVTDIFSVPGDFNLTLLDHLIAEPELKNIGCCNELNAGYAADGYARSRGVGACVVTFTVGGLSVLNAIAGAYSENLPVICIVGGPNSNDFGTNRILHHTIGLPDFSQELRCFQTVTCHQAVVNNLEDAHEQIDKAISTALKESKPVYISISCNLAATPHPTFIRDPNIGCCNELNAGYAADGYARSRGVGACVVTFTVGGLSVLNAIAGAYSENLPVICIVGGPNSNDFGTNRILHHTIGLPDFSQELRCFQTVTCHQAVVNNLEDAHEQIDKAISTALKESKPVYISISCNLAATPHPTFIRDPVPFSLTPRLSNKMGLEAAVEATLEFLNKAVKPVMVGGVKLRMQYGSIGWSVGATLGYAQAVPEKRVLAFIGDGSFQVTAQDVSTMLRNGQKTIIFLINNGGYTIEVEIHDGPYNVIKNWNYTGLVDAIHNGEGKCWTTKVRYEEELVEAIKTATTEKKDSLCFIEVIVHKDDTSKELLEWGSRVAAANGRPPNPQ